MECDRDRRFDCVSYFLIGRYTLVQRLEPILPDDRNNLTPYFTNFDELDKSVFNIRCLDAVQGIKTTDVMTGGVRRPPATWS